MGLGVAWFGWLPGSPNIFQGLSRAQTAKA